MHRDAESPALGRAHFRGPGGWEPRDLPRNVRFLGHLDGDEKRDRLSSAWALVNTSIHESLPTSFLESLACETPIVSCTNEDDVARRFGVFTGNAGGDGVALLPAFEAGLRGLLECEDIRVARGQGGR
ncbi:MAG: glycosyltransferase, partial [Vicinamibacterales bacterium]